MSRNPLNTETHKFCPRCQTLKLRTEFYPNKTTHDKLQGRCKPCNIEEVRRYHKAKPERHAAYNRDWDRRNPVKKKDAALKGRLGLPAGTYAAMHAAQEGKCAICGTTKAGGKSDRLHVDHCEETQTIRGLLCSCCNTGIGQLKHNETLLLAAIHYLKNYPGIPQPKLAENADVDSIRIIKEALEIKVP